MKKMILLAMFCSLAAGCSPNYLELGDGGSGCGVIRGGGPINIGAPQGDITICRTTHENASLSVRTNDTIVVIQHGGAVK